MGSIFEETRFAGGFVAGVAGTFLTWQFGAAVLTSGWTSAACSVALLAGAGAVAAGRWLGDGVDPVMPDLNRPRWPLSAEPALRQSDRPRDWLRANGAPSVPAMEMDGFLRARLSACLRHRTDAMQGTDLPALPQPVAALATALAALAADRGNGSLRRDGARLIRSLATCCGHTGAERTASMGEVMAEARRLAAHPEASRVYEGVASRHAMTETFMMGLLEAARCNAPLGPNEFGWLKGIDRGLWYALDNLGRRTFHVEGLAAMDHYAHEKASGGKLSAPQVGNAVYALSLVMRSMHEEALGEKRDAWAEVEVHPFDPHGKDEAGLRP